MEQVQSSTDTESLKEQVEEPVIEQPIVHALEEENNSNEDNTVSDHSIEEDEDEDDEDEQDGGDSDSEIGQNVAIDLSDNDYYKALCTLLEDEHGNNILEYISLLHTELIGVNKNLRLVRKEMNRMANCAEIMVKKSS